MGIGKELLDALAELHITEATGVQEKVIPIIAQGRHILFQSETGTGKTFAYLLPLLQKMATEENPRKSVRLLIASPTLELASQIRNQVKLISGIKCALCIGGSPLSRQIEALKGKPEIVIGGPARLLELIHLKKLKTEGIAALVLDEADRLLSPELRDATEGLIERLPEKIQLIGNSATVSAYTRSILLASRKEADIELVELPAEDILRKKISHWAIFAERRDKIDTLRSFINAVKPAKLLVFTARSDQIENIVSKLRWKNIDCAGLSAKTDKKERKAAFDRFKGGKIPILVTTDLASRGLDIPGITHVVQMDLPEESDFFIHRAGRTGRAGQTGINCVIGDALEMQRYAALEKKLHLTVYPKMLYKGQLTEPQGITEAAAPQASRKRER